MRHFAIYKESGDLFAIGTGSGGVEISEAEYIALHEMIVAKFDMVSKLYSGEITIDSVPAEWREEIQRRVEERIAAVAAAEAEQEMLNSETDELIDVEDISNEQEEGN